MAKGMATIKTERNEARDAVAASWKRVAEIEAEWDKREDEHIKKHNEYEQWIQEAEKIMKNTSENVERELEVIKNEYEGQLNATNDELEKMKKEFVGMLDFKNDEITRMMEGCKQKL